MIFRVVVVGKPRNRALGEAIADYESRAARYWPLEFHEVREARDGSVPVVQSKEGERVLASSAGSWLVVCDREGKDLDSHGFAAWLRRHHERARDVTLAIGGAHGFDQQ